MEISSSMKRAIEAGAVFVGPPVDDPMMNFSWIGFLVVATVYTFAVFRNDLSRDGPLIITTENARSPFGVLVMHLEFLAFMLLAAWGMPYLLPELPSWVTSQVRGRGIDVTLFDLFCLFALIFLQKVERHCLFKPAEG